MKKRSHKNKTHFAVRPGNKGPRRALCGSDAGLKSGNVVPTSKEWRDVDCLLCKRARKKGK
jgi:hypothetical protein